MADNVIPLRGQWRDDWVDPYDDGFDGCDAADEEWGPMTPEARARLDGALRLCEQLGLDPFGTGQRRGPPPPPPEPVPPEPPGYEKQLAWLGTIVGGDEALLALDLAPLVPEELDLSGVRAELQQRVARLVDAAEEVLEPAVGDEGVAVARRLLPRAVQAAPGLLSTDRDDILAGALVHAVAQGNGLLGPDRPLPGRVVMSLCGLRSSPAQRAQAIVQALGVGWWPGHAGGWAYLRQPDVWPLGSPDLLVSGFRRQLARMRDVALSMRERAAG